MRLSERTTQEEKIKLICLFVIGAFFALLLTGCGTTSVEQTEMEESYSEDTEQVDEKQVACLEAIKEGLEARFDLDDDNVASLEAFKAYLEEAINTETAPVIKYEKETFQDKQFEETVKKYIDALSSEYDALEYFYTDNNKFHELYTEKGVIPRGECLKVLKEDYGLSLSANNNRYLNRATEPEKYFTDRIAPGNAISVDTELGTLEITIEDIKYNDSWTEYEQLGPSNSFATLTCAVKNVSYYDEYNPGLVNLAYAITVQDQDGFVVEACGTGYDLAGYNTAAGAYDQLEKGQQKKMVIGYVFDNTNEYAEVFVGKNKSMIIALQP